MFWPTNFKLSEAMLCCGMIRSTSVCTVANGRFGVSGGSVGQSEASFPAAAADHWVPTNDAGSACFGMNCQSRRLKL